MNNKGWGLTMMLVLCGVLALALIISAIIYEQTFHDDLLPDTPPSENLDPDVKEFYESLEAKVVDAGITYFDKYYPTLSEGDTVHVSVRRLQVENLLGDIIDQKDNTCSGYASYKREEGIDQYDSYIRCGDDYITKGYRSEYDQ